MIINSSLVDMELADKQRLQTYSVPANEIADKIGNSRMANMVALGAYIQVTGIIPLSTVQESLENVISSHYKHLIPKNAEALQAGADYVKG